MSIRKRSKKTQKRNKELLDLYLEIWNERPHYCEVSGWYLGELPQADFFSHVLAKGAEPRAIMDKDNIMLNHPTIHHEWEFGDRNDQKFDKMRKRQEEIKRKYNCKS